ncbi:hypothetical protein EYC95_26585, partial [Pseudomonas sp. BGI-2]
LDHLHDFQLEAVVECSAFVGHENLLDRCIFHLSRCPGKLDHYSMGVVFDCYYKKFTSIRSTSSFIN